MAHSSGASQSHSSMASDGLRAPTPAAAVADRQWFILSRWQQYAGEARANLLRIIAIAAFYGIELLNYHGVNLGPFEMPASVDLKFHQAMTALAVAWTMVALATHVCLRLHIFPSTLKYATTACDVVLLTTILTVADGPRSPLVVGYFLVIAGSTLRFHLTLVRCATVGCMAGYVWLLGFARWFADPARLLEVPRYQQLIVLLALAMTGIILGQVVRQVRGLAEDFARRIGAAR